MRCFVLFSSLVAVLLTTSPGWSQTAPTLESRVQSLEATVAKLTRYIQVIEDAATSTYHGLSGPHVVFTGANVHIRSGSGVTHKGRWVNGDWESEAVGLGNLIIGYNEANTKPTADTAQRGGSHNLVIGRYHQYPNSGGLVAGHNNVISGYAASVSGGGGNEAQGKDSSVSGGLDNTASGAHASVSGGRGNTATSSASSVSGGYQNTASGYTASVSGGYGNWATADYASVSGGLDNRAIGYYSSVSGGRLNMASGRVSSVSGGRANAASEHWASVLGGHRNRASGRLSSVSGGDGLTATGVVDFRYLWPACLRTKPPAVRNQVKADVVFEGCNVHFRNGASSTNTTNGLGNLIVGYNEDLNTVGVSAPRTLGTNDRSGSHNVVIGPEHEYSSHSGLVVGVGNIISGEYASVSGGRDNEASGDYGSVSGGQNNEASGDAASVSGGLANVASGSYASVSGGNNNTAGPASASSVSGGRLNRATGEAASVSGGYHNWASGKRSSISGGKNQTANADL